MQNQEEDTQCNTVYDNISSLIERLRTKPRNIGKTYVTKALHDSIKNNINILPSDVNGSTDNIDFQVLEEPDNAYAVICIDYSDGYETPDDLLCEL
tara:strand:- start:438 stop:725 length:288 start_codon:yes stop_codon:yes gene_type:complete